MKPMSRVKGLINVIKIYKKAYTNWPLVLLNLLIKGKGCAKERSGVELCGEKRDVGALAHLLAEPGVQYVYLKKENNEIVVGHNGKRIVAPLNEIGILTALIKLLNEGPVQLLDNYDESTNYTLKFLYGGRTYSLRTHDLLTFYDAVKTYEKLDVSNKNVLVIGAYVGDSPLMFAARGAKKVIAVEPSPWAFEMAKYNVEANGLSDKIILLNCGISRKSGNIALPKRPVHRTFLVTYDAYYTFDEPNKEDPTHGNASMASGALESVEVPLCTFDYIVEKFGPFDVLEMDCEGCEYEAVLCSDQIAGFKQIMMEYHYGYEILKSRLETLGFKVTVTGPFKTEKPAVGTLYAVRSS